MVDTVVRERIVEALTGHLGKGRTPVGEREALERAADAVLGALGLEQYGEGWHQNRWTGELEPTEDEGFHTRLYRLWGLDPAPPDEEAR